MLFCRVLIEIYVWFKCWMIWDCKEDVDGLYVWQSVILDKERNCNLGDVLLVLNEWLIITTKFLYGCHLWIRHSILQKYEDSMSNCVLSTKTELYLYTKKEKKKKKFPVLLTYHIVTGVSAFESVHGDMSYIVWRKQLQNGQTIAFMKTAIQTL